MNSQAAAVSLSSPRWLGWASFLVVLYLAVAAVGWQRTLITTESWALYYSTQPWPEFWRMFREDLVHPPLIYLVERAWFHLFGQTDNTAKALALIINIPTLFLFTYLARSVTGQWRLASFLFASVFLTVASTPNQVRMYGLGLLWAVAAILLWERWRTNPTTGSLLSWSVVMLLLVYTHFFGLLLLVGFFSVNGLFGPRRGYFTAASALVGVAYLPWLFYVLPEYLQEGLRSKIVWVSPRPYLLLAELPYTYLGYMGLQELRLELSLAAAAIHFFLFVLAWRTIRQLWPPQRAAEAEARWFWTLALLAGVPIVLLYAFSVTVTPAFHARFILGVLPAYWLVLVLLGQFGRRAGRVLLYAVVLPWTLVSAGLSLERSYHPSPARQGAELLAQEMRAADMILCDGLDWGNAVYWEWTRRLGRTGRIEVLRYGSPISRLSVRPQKTFEQLELGGVDRVWFFYSDKTSASEVTDFLASRGFVPDEPLAGSQPYLLPFVRPGQQPGTDHHGDTQF